MLGHEHIVLLLLSFSLFLLEVRKKGQVGAAGGTRAGSLYLASTIDHRYVKMSNVKVSSYIRVCK